MAPLLQLLLRIRVFFSWILIQTNELKFPSFAFDGIRQTTHSICRDIIVIEIQDLQ